MTEKIVGLDNPELNQEANDIWDRIAGPWDEDFGPDGNQHNAYITDPVTDRLLDLKQGETVLDIACGAGRYARRMAEYGANGVGVDQSAEFLNLAKTNSKQTGVDVANCTMGLMNMASITPLARALPGLIKPGGRFVFFVAHPVFGRASARRKIEDDHSTETSRHTITSWDYLDATPDMGLSVRKQAEKQYFFDRPIGMLLNAFFEHGLVMDRLEEPVFPDEVENPRPTGWANFKLMPFSMACRLRRIAV